MKKLIIIALLLIPQIIVADTFGKTDVGTTGDVDIEDRIYCLDATPDLPGEATSISVHTEIFSSHTYKAGLYLNSDSSFVDETEELTIGEPGGVEDWFEFDFASPVPITVQTYNICIWTNSPDGSATASYKSSTGGALDSQTYNGWPDPGGFIVPSVDIAIFATYTPSPVDLIIGDTDLVIGDTNLVIN